MKLVWNRGNKPLSGCIEGRFGKRGKPPIPGNGWFISETPPGMRGMGGNPENGDEVKLGGVWDTNPDEFGDEFIIGDPDGDPGADGRPADFAGLDSGDLG